MEKVIVKRKKRPKAFIGAIIGAVGGIASGIIGGIEAKKAAKAEAMAQQLANRKQEASNLTQTYANDAQREKEFQDRFRTEYKEGGSIHIKPSKRGTFTAAATKHGQSVQGFASKVLANKDNYSPAMVKKANFARNAASWKHELGGSESSQLTPKRLDTPSNTIVQNRSNVARKRLESADMDLDADRTEYAKGGRVKYKDGGEEDKDKETYTSEDINNPVYSKKKPLSIKKEKEIFIEEPKYRGGKQFEKAGKIAAGVIRLHPTYGIGMNVIDAVEAAKSKDSESYMSNVVGGMAKGIYKAGTGNPANKFDYKTARNKVGNKVLKKAGIVASAQDYISDAKDLYKEVTTPIKYAKGGKRKCAKGGVEPVITEGGNGVAVGDSLTLLRGRKHKTGGIVIGKGQNSIEAESGEVVKREKNQMKIFSAEPILKGKSPAQKVLESPSKANQVFQEQESYKERNNLNNDGTRKALFGLKKKITNGDNDPNDEDALSEKLSKSASVIGAISPLISGALSMSSIGKIKSPSAPLAPSKYTAAKLKTDYNINPQLAELERNRQLASGDIDRNTASSVAALARKQRIGTDTTMQKNLLFGQRENIETELLNREAMNQQQVAAQNVAQENAYKSQLNEYEFRKSQLETEKRLAKADVSSQMIEGTVSAARDWQSRRDKKDQELNAMAAEMAKNPEQTDLFMKKHKEYKSFLKGKKYGCGGKMKLKRKK